MQYKTNLILVSYELNTRFKQCNYIQFTSDLKRVFNTRTSKEITTSNNMKKGFWLNRKFYRLDRIKNEIELIPKHEYIKDDFLTNL